ncbi:MAG: replication-relaxation family protein, partial [Ktedonobacteraceae bacterium]|nr:replication-relaxation family protein [Ktedonobacteraceae bacterium]
LHLCEIRAHWEDTPLRQRGVQRLQRLIRHTAGIYGFLTTLTRQARTQGHTLAWWETGARCARRYHYQGAWHNLRPDALFEYQAQEHCHRVWLEWDEGSMRRSQLQTKLEAYATYVRSRQWYAEAPRLPLLMFVVPEYDQEVRVAEIVQRVLGKTSMVAYITTAALLTQRGPLSEIWKLVLPTAESKHDAHRVCWI